MVTHDMHTARKVADRVIMLYPLSRLRPDEPQMIFDGPPEQARPARDPRVTQFVNGEAGERLMEMRKMADRRASRVDDSEPAVSDRSRIARQRLSWTNESSNSASG